MTYLFIGYSDEWQCGGKTYSNTTMETFKKVKALLILRTVYGLPELKLLLLKSSHRGSNLVASVENLVDYNPKIIAILLSCFKFVMC